MVFGVSMSSVVDNVMGQEKKDSMGNIETSLLFDLINEVYEDDTELIVESVDTDSPHAQVASIHFEASIESSLSATGAEFAMYYNEEEEKDILLTTSDGSALVNLSVPETEIPERKREWIVSYIVQPGDTVSSIAAKFKLKISTVLWCNGKRIDDFIKPGEKLYIPPVDGLIYKVQEGDTLTKIAGKYKNVNIQKVISFNKLEDNGSKLKPGDILILPGAKMKPTPKPTPSQQIASRSTESNNRASAGVRRYTGGGSMWGSGPWPRHSFPYGWCTWYVATRRYVPWGGNAGTWIHNCKRYGFKTGRTPVVGAIVVTRESWWGHVGYVEAVYSNGTFKISEMNYGGWGRTSTRVLSYSAPQIMGFIYGR